jgi:hypothetical protein
MRCIAHCVVCLCAHTHGAVAPRFCWAGLLVYNAHCAVGRAICPNAWPKIRGLDLVSTPGVFYTYFYNYARRLRLEKLLYVELSRSSSRYFKPLLDPGNCFASETPIRRFQKRNGRYVAVSEVKRLQIYSGYHICNGRFPTVTNSRLGVTVM